MTAPIPAQLLERFATFGELLRYLRRRAGLTQTELSIAVGCSDAQISRLEQNLRLPNIPNIEARFLPALGLKHEAAARERLLALAMGRTEESLAASNRCLELDPLDLVINIHMAWHHQFARQYEEAVEQCWKTNELHPNSFWPPYFFGMAYQQQGKIAAAAVEYQKAIQMSGNVTFTTAGLGHLYASSGRSAEARAIFAELRTRAQNTYVPAYDLALVCVGLEATDEAFEWLYKAYEERCGWLTYLKVEPRMDALRSDSRFNDLLRRLRLMP